MIRTKPTLYTILGLVIAITTIAVMSVYATYNYRATKNQFIQEMHSSSAASAFALRATITDLMSAYAIQEYEQLVTTEIERRNNLAIIIEDNNMGKLLGKTSFFSGKIRDANWNIIDYDSANQDQNKQLEDSYYIDSYDIIGPTKNKIGTITIYTSDRLLTLKLNSIVKDTFFQIFLITLLMVIMMMISIKHFITRPLSRIIATITQTGADGIPTKKIPDHYSKEISFLTHSMNTMVKTVQMSRVELQEKNKKILLSSRVFSNSQEGIIITGMDKKIIDINPALCKMSGYSRDELIGQAARSLHSGDETPDFYTAMWQQINKHDHWQGEVWNRKKNGELYATLLSISALKDEFNRVTNYIGSFTDITENKQQQEKLSFLAHYDALTRLPNRTLFIDRFHQAIAHSKRNKSMLAVCFLDLDNFKDINDSYGHEVGDKLLIEVANRITNCTREEDTTSRQGGDEFAILLGDIKSYAQCEQSLDRIHRSLARPYSINGLNHKITASCGVTLYPEDDGDIDTLLRHADQSMYAAKLSGKNSYRLFSSTDEKKSINKQRQLKRLKHALACHEFSLYYQPKVNMVTGDAFGAEALIRWIHPEKGLIPPLDFLPTIEGTDLEIDMGNWVINEALSHLATCHQQGIKTDISINISSHHLLSETFLAELENALNNHPSVNPQSLELEILESSALGDLHAVTTVIKACKNNLGVTVALDDFGTGYSSLTHLRNLPANTIKIDRSFVKDVINDPSDFAIIDSIIGIEVIAEGVETTAHGLMLIIMGCQKAQGYGIARPMPFDDLIPWLKTYTPNQEWLVFGNQQQLTAKESKVSLLKLVTQQWKNAFINNIQSAPEELENWPIMDTEHCPCGSWVKRAIKEKAFEADDLEQLSEAHKKLHRVAYALLLTYQGGEYKQARDRLPELQLVYDEVYSILKSL